MKKYLMRIFLTCCALCLAGNALAELRKDAIAVLPFELQGSDFETEDLGAMVSEWLITAFVRDGRFDIVERKLLDRVMEEHQMAEAGMITGESAMQIGRVLGVKAIISGSVMKYSRIVEVNARVIDVENGSIMTAENIRCRDVALLHDQVEQMAGQIAGNFPLAGLVVKREEQRVIIALGETAGVKPGMAFTGYREGEVIRHPKTGEELYVEQEETGRIKITEVQKNVSIGVITEEAEPGRVAQGDFVKSVKPPEAASAPFPQVAERPLPDRYTAWMAATDFQEEFDRNLKLTNYPEIVEGRCGESANQYRGLFEPYPQGMFYFYAKFGLQEEQFTETDTEYTRKGYDKTWSQKFTCQGNDYYQAVWTFHQTSDENKKSGTGGWFGAMIQDVTDELAKTMQLDSRMGVVVQQVAEGSPAQQAGIEPADVILRLNGMEMYGSVSVVKYLSKVPVGVNVTVDLLRDGKARKVVVTVGERPSQ